MAGMAWTLHPALFYDKYGPVLVQLWESGALGTLFRPVRRLSRTIGDALTSGFASRAQAGSDAELGEASALHLSDISVATDDEAFTRVNRDPGDTSSEPSTSQQNELAFQGDLYTQMRRNRRQQERIEKIRETRRKFLEGSGCSASSKKRRVPGQGGSILISKKEKTLRMKLGGGGTPLADMEALPQARGVVIDAGDSSNSGESSGNEEAAAPAAKRGGKILAQELLADNDSLKAFRVIRGGRKKGGASPPPDFRRQSETETEETGSVSSEKRNQVLSMSSPGIVSDVTTSTEGPPKHSALKKEHITTRRGSKTSIASILHSSKDTEKKTLELPDAEQAQRVGPTSPAIGSLESPTSASKSNQLPLSGVSTTTAHCKDERLSTEESSSTVSPSVAVEKEEKVKKRRRKARSHKKKGKRKSKVARRGKREQPAGSKAEDRELRAGVESQGPSHDMASYSASRSQPAVTSSESTEDRVTASVKLPTDATLENETKEATVSQNVPMPKPGSTKHGTFKEAKILSPRVQESGISSKKAGPWSQVEEAVEMVASTSSLAAPGHSSTKRHKKHAKKHTSRLAAAAEETSSHQPGDDARDETDAKSPTPLSPESTEKMFDKAAATHGIRSGRSGHKKHHKGAKRSLKKKAAPSSKPSSLAVAGQAQPEMQKAGAAPSQATREVDTSSPPYQEGANAAEVAGVSTSSASSVRRLLNLPSTDITASDVSNTRNLTTEQRPGNVTVVEGNDVTIRLDLTSSNRKFMFWPFRLKGKKKK